MYRVNYEKVDVENDERVKAIFEEYNKTANFDNWQDKEWEVELKIKLISFVIFLEQMGTVHIEEIEE